MLIVVSSDITWYSTCSPFVSYQYWSPIVTS